jgi:hypothetical protein
VELMVGGDEPSKGIHGVEKEGVVIGIVFLDRSDPDTEEGDLGFEIRLGNLRNGFNQLLFFGLHKMVHPVAFPSL